MKAYIGTRATVGSWPTLFRLELRPEDGHAALIGRQLIEMGFGVDLDDGILVVRPIQKEDEAESFPLRS